MNTIMNAAIDYLYIGGMILLSILTGVSVISFIKHLILMARYKTLSMKISRSLRERHFESDQ